MAGQRCMAPIRDAAPLPLYCGMIAKSADANGRPVCTLHGRTGHPAQHWSGGDETYPHGTADGGRSGRWEFAYGLPRGQAFASGRELDAMVEHRDDSDQPAGKEWELAVLRRQLRRLIAARHQTPLNPVDQAEFDQLNQRKAKLLGRD